MACGVEDAAEGKVKTILLWTTWKFKSAYLSSSVSLNRILVELKATPGMAMFLGVRGVHIA